jgi:TPP-dependent pyruvate/acetoin dehydrogenase alpha subunit
MKKLEKNELIDLYAKMVKIRAVEETLLDMFSKGEIPGFLHVCIGQEATPTAICSHLKETDYLAITHRGHGHALAKGMDLKLFMAELLGKKNGVCRGRAGSLHLADHSLGILGANGIVGGGIPIATGAAFAAKYKKTGQVIVCLFGDGATGAGTFHEALNMASLWNLPIVYVCENNGWAELTPQTVHMPVEEVAARAAAYKMPGIALPNELFTILDEAGKAIDRARAGKGPSLLEVKSSRWYGHFVGDAQKYRPAEDIEKARKEDCILKFEKRLLKDKLLTQKRISKIREDILGEIETAVDFARESPFPDESELMDALYA